MKPWILIHNPGARKGRKTWRTIAPLVQQAAREVQIVAPEDLERTQEDVPPGRVIAVGGDGTVNLALRWLARHGWLSESDLAVVPAGTGNNLARGLGLPVQVRSAAEVALDSQRTIPLDVWKIDLDGGSAEELLIQSGALGFPAEIAARYEQLRSHPAWRWILRPLGPGVYRWLALAGLRSQKRRERRGEDLLEIGFQSNTERLNHQALALFIGNERSLGGNFFPCPEASMDDQILDFCFILAGTGASYLKLFRLVSRGEHLGEVNSIVYRRDRGPVELKFSRPLPLLVDGDIRHHARTLLIERLEEPSRIVVPSASP